ncbi:MAG: hypothetical protein NWQ54_21585, partial [Paraglaciecola sp.]|nr:hypothetical protein [Paraglaciecola sp.]
MHSIRFYKVKYWLVFCLLLSVGKTLAKESIEHKTNTLPMSVSQHLALPLECKTIPTRHEQICVATTQA